MVHLYGQPCDIDEIHSIAKRHGLRVIEDAAQAHGATYKGQRIGGHSDVVTWSFYPGKNLGAFGDGGAITTNDQGLAGKIQVLGNYGAIEKYEHSELGVNSRLDPVQAAVLDVKLKFLESWNQQRTEIAKTYFGELKNPKIQLPVEKKESSSAWHLFVIRTKVRNQLQDHLNKSGVESLIHYPKPPSKQKCYSHYQALTKAEKISNEVLSIPIGPHLSSEAVDYVCESINKFD
jgi:dTDP-4-amino-4,6-dideoxygalactose transaminase